MNTQTKNIEYHLVLNIRNDRLVKREVKKVFSSDQYEKALREKIRMDNRYGTFVYDLIKVSL